MACVPSNAEERSDTSARPLDACPGSRSGQRHCTRSRSGNRQQVTVRNTRVNCSLMCELHQLQQGATLRAVKRPLLCTGCATAKRALLIGTKIKVHTYQRWHIFQKSPSCKEGKIRLRQIHTNIQFYLTASASKCLKIQNPAENRRGWFAADGYCFQGVAGSTNSSSTPPVSSGLK